MRAFALVLLLGALTACGPSGPGLREEEIYAFGTIVSLTTWGVDEATSRQASDMLGADFEYMHSAWHAWQPGTLGRINTLLATGEEFTVAPSILALIDKSTELSLRSGELFNPAIGKLVALWGFHRDDPGAEPPDAETVRALVDSAPSMRDIHISGITMRCDNPDVHLDFGAFAKGFGIDRVVEKLQAMGIHNGILNAGGDLRAFGRHGDRPWRIGIRNPWQPGVLASLEIQGDESVYTSGDYERYYEGEKKRVHHIIDPRTGYPAEGAVSVTVVHGEGATADAAATALFVAGPDEWVEVARAMGLSQVMLIDAKGVVHVTPGLAARMEFEIDPPPPIVVHELR